MNRQNNRKNLSRALAAALSITGCGAAHALTVDATVNALDGPWEYVSGGLNTNYQYGTDDQAAPLVIDSTEGLAFTAGSTITINYVSGSSNEGGYSSPDADGDPSFVTNTGTGSSGKVFPSYYFDPATYPTYLGELCATFANASGTIVGTPFKVGDTLSIVVPAGATQIQFGLVDDIYHDNSGSYAITVMGTAVPEPSALALLGVGVAVGGAYLLRRRTAAA